MAFICITPYSEVKNLFCLADEFSYSNLFLLCFEQMMNQMMVLIITLSFWVSPIFSCCLSWLTLGLTFQM